MGVHTGSPQCTVNPGTGKMDYQGPMVNKAARVASLARGGTVLASEDSWRSFKDQIDTRRIFCRQVGKVVLRGFTAEDLIFEAVPRTL
jgi:class 3 adenylate cyclase